MDYTDSLEKRINPDETSEAIIEFDNPRMFQELVNIHDNLQTDIRNSSIEKNKSCPFCDFKSYEIDNLKSHIYSTHTIVKHKQCPYCQIKNLSQVKINQHIRAHHGDKLIHICNECDYRAAKKENLNVHIQNNHTNDKCHVCNICGYTTAVRSKLKFHLASTHKTEKCYLCPMCNYRAAVSGTLKTHIMAKHEKKRPHKCPKCRYKATQIGTLNRHFARHFKSNSYRFKSSDIVEVNETVNKPCTKEGTHVELSEHNIPPIYTLKPRNLQNLRCNVNQSSKIKSSLSDFVNFQNENIAVSHYNCHICRYSGTDEKSLNIHFIEQHTNQYLDSFSKNLEQTLQMCRIER